MGSLDGKQALVTRGGRGLGRGIVEALLGAGARVHPVARTADSLAALRVEAGGRLAVTAADAANPIVAGQLPDAVRPDVLVLNAGAAPLSRPLHQHTWESFSRNWVGDELWQRAQRDTLLVVVQVLGGRCAPAASAKEQPTCRGSGVQPRGGHPSRARCWRIEPSILQQVPYRARRGE